MSHEQYCKKHKDAILRRRKDGNGYYCPICVGGKFKEPRDMKTTRKKFLHKKHCKWTEEGHFIGKTRPAKKGSKHKRRKK